VLQHEEICQQCRKQSLDPNRESRGNAQDPARVQEWPAGFISGHSLRAENRHSLVYRMVKRINDAILRPPRRRNRSRTVSTEKAARLDMAEASIQHAPLVQPPRFGVFMTKRLV